MGVHCIHVLQHQHAEQLGVRLQYQRAGAHHPPQFWKRDHDDSRLPTWEALQPSANPERCAFDNGRAHQCVGRFGAQGES